MAYVEAHAGLRDHLKTKKVARLLGVPKVQVIGHLLCLWWWCQEYAQDGDLSGFDCADIADAAEWEGEPETFVNALLNCGAKGGAGFLHHDDDTGALLVNDWYQYGGKLFVQREQAAERMRKMRARNANNTDGYADVTRNDTVTVTRVTPIDKIREDNNISSADAAPAGASTSPSSPPSTPKPSKPKRAKEENPLAPQQEFFGAVCTCVGWDSKTITEEQKGRVAQTMGVLQKAGYTLDDLRTFWRYWHEEDWRGQKGQLPTLSQLRAEIGKIRAYTPPAAANGKVTGFSLAELTGGA